MRNRYHVLFVLFLAVITMTAGAQTELKAAVGLSLPPYIIQGPDNGVDADIVRQALLASNYTLKLEYVPVCAGGGEPGQQERRLRLSHQRGFGGHGRLLQRFSHQLPERCRRAQVEGPEDRLPGDLHDPEGRGIRGRGELSRPGLRGHGQGEQELFGRLPISSRRSRCCSRTAPTPLSWTSISSSTSGRTSRTWTSARMSSFYQIFPPTAYKVAFTSKDVCEKFNAGLKAIKASGKVRGDFQDLHQGIATAAPPMGRRTKHHGQGMRYRGSKKRGRRTRRESGAGLSIPVN